MGRRKGRPLKRGWPQKSWGALRAIVEQCQVEIHIRVSMETLQSAECGRAIEMRYARRGTKRTSCGDHEVILLSAANWGIAHGCQLLGFQLSANVSFLAVEVLAGAQFVMQIDRHLQKWCLLRKQQVQLSRFKSGRSNCKDLVQRTVQCNWDTPGNWILSRMRWSWRFDCHSRRRWVI